MTLSVPPTSLLSHSPQQFSKQLNKIFQGGTQVMPVCSDYIVSTRRTSAVFCADPFSSISSFITLKKVQVFFISLQDPCGSFSLWPSAVSVYTTYFCYSCSVLITLFPHLKSPVQCMNLKTLLSALHNLALINFSPYFSFSLINALDQLMSITYTSLLSLPWDFAHALYPTCTYQDPICYSRFLKIYLSECTRAINRIHNQQQLKPEVF